MIRLENLCWIGAYTGEWITFSWRLGANLGGPCWANTDSKTSVFFCLFPLEFPVLVAVRKCLLCAHQACITLLLLLFVGDAKIWNTRTLWEAEGTDERPSCHEGQHATIHWWSRHTGGGSIKAFAANPAFVYWASGAFCQRHREVGWSWIWISNQVSFHLKMDTSPHFFLFDNDGEKKNNKQEP